MEEIRQGVRIPSKIIALIVSSSTFFAIYGAIIGSSHSLAQALSAAIKLPVLYLLTLIICLPTLYIFSTLFGSRRSLGQHFALLLSAVTVISILLFAFSPVTLFFVITNPIAQSQGNYQFFKLLNVVVFAFTGLIGTKSLYQGLKLLSEQDAEGQATRKTILQLWLILYAFVGSQLGWVLRPFFGYPNSPFEPIREMQGNFYLDIVKAIGEILGWH
jgi:glucan phosphoethanolaminetransferase (alkaline phosphatase superfamily)